MTLALAGCGGDDASSSTDPVDTTIVDSVLDDTTPDARSTSAPATAPTDPDATNPSSPTTAPTETTAPTTTDAMPTDVTSTTDVTPTAAPTSTVAATTVTPTTTAEPRLDGAAVLAAWPDPPPPPELADVPYLLPSGPISGVVEAVRFAETRPPNDRAAMQYLEIWRADGAPIRLDVTTLPGTAADPFDVLDPEPVDVDGWDEAKLLEFGDGSISLQLIDEAGYVSLDTMGIEIDDVLAIGRSLEPMSDVGWTIGNAPLGLHRLDGAWTVSTTGSAYREIDWYGTDGRLEAELAISVDDVQRYRIPDVPNGKDRLVDVNGATALVVEWPAPAGPVFVIWSPEPDLVVSFTSMLSVDDAVATARSIIEVDEATWNSVSTIDPLRDGCTSFVC